MLSSKAKWQNIFVAKGNCKSVLVCITQNVPVVSTSIYFIIKRSYNDLSLLTYSTLFMHCSSLWIGVSSLSQTVKADLILIKCTMNRWSLSPASRDIKHCEASSPLLQKASQPWNPNFVTVQSKVMMLRYSLEDSSMSHPQPNLHYSTVGLPLHPRGCLLRACEAQWTEFQWADSFFCLSVRTYRVHIYCTLTIWHKQKCWDASLLHAASSTSLSFTLDGLLSAFPLLCLCSSLVWALFLFLPSLAVYKEESHAPIGWLVSLSQRCHYWNPTGLMLIYTHRWAPKQS